MDKSENTIRDKGRKKKLGWIGENDAGQKDRERLSYTF